MPPARPLKVLHVDDEPLNLHIVQEILTAFGHIGVKALSGPEALERLERETFDVVLMDIHMPGMNGVETVRRLRESDCPQRNIPVIALTADVVTRKPKEYLDLGFNDFLSKPIMVARFTATVAAAAEPVRPPLRRAS